MRRGLRRSSGLAAVSLAVVLWANITAYSIERLACAGTSITQADGNGGYVEMLADSLGSGWTVGNYGSGGKTVLRGTGSGDDGTYWGCDQFLGVFSFKPTVITIEFGTNDSKDIYWPLHRDEFVRDYCALIDTFRTITSVKKVYICKPTPEFSSDDGFQPAVMHDEIVPRIDSIARLRNCTVIDLHTPLQNRSDLFSDGIHPTTEGHRVLSSIFYRALMSPTGTTIYPAQSRHYAVAHRPVLYTKGKAPALFRADDGSGRGVFDLSGRLVHISLGIQ